MKLNIEFEIDELEAADLINQLQNVVAQSNSQVLNNLLIEIQKDTKTSGAIAQKFMMWLRNYTSASVSLESEFKYHLGFADWWLASDNGLAQLCNLTLRDVRAQFGGEYKKIKGSTVSKKKKVKDVVQLLIENYEL